MNNSYVDDYLRLISLLRNPGKESTLEDLLWNESVIECMDEILKHAPKSTYTKLKTLTL